VTTVNLFFFQQRIASWTIELTQFTDTNAILQCGNALLTLVFDVSLDHRSNHGSTGSSWYRRTTYKQISYNYYMTEEDSKEKYHASLSIDLHRIWCVYALVNFILFTGASPCDPTPPERLPLNPLGQFQHHDSLTVCHIGLYLYVRNIIPYVTVWSECIRFSKGSGCGI